MAVEGRPGHGQIEVIRNSNGSRKMRIALRPTEARQGRITRNWPIFLATLAAACVGFIVLGLAVT